jgi:large subunit ribosomal protein L24
MKLTSAGGYPEYKKSDLVQVISGKHKGKKGKILKMLKGDGLIVVEKVNIVKKHKKPTQQNPKGEIVEMEAPLHVSKVLPISTKLGKPVRVSVWLKEKGGGKAKKARGTK